MTVEIPLSRGLVALVDDDDAPLVQAAGSWHATPSGHTFYARRNHWVGARCISTRMHNLITGLPYVDHENGNGLDNRRANLRPASHGQNMGNKRRYRNNASGFKGVSWHRVSGRWVAQASIAGKRCHLGLFDNPIDAALAYDAAALEAYGEFARLNFPQEIAS
jgi:hypothetical protein